jgi:hypothetical protein
VRLLPAKHAPGYKLNISSLIPATKQRYPSQTINHLTRIYEKRNHHLHLLAAALMLLIH